MPCGDAAHTRTAWRCGCAGIWCSRGSNSGCNPRRRARAPTAPYAPATKRKVHHSDFDGHYCLRSDVTWPTASSCSPPGLRDNEKSVPALRVALGSDVVFRSRACVGRGKWVNTSGTGALRETRELARVAAGAARQRGLLWIRPTTVTFSGGSQGPPRSPVRHHLGDLERRFVPAQRGCECARGAAGSTTPCELRQGACRATLRS